MSAFSSPGDTMGQLPRTNISYQSDGSKPKGPLNELELNVSWTIMSDATKVKGTVTPSTYRSEKVQNITFTESSLNEQTDGGKVSRPINVMKPRGELVCLRVNEIEDHLKRQSLQRQSVGASRFTLSN
jgi:hypothetical protein